MDRFFSPLALSVSSSAMALLGGVLLAPTPALAANVLVVSDGTSDLSIAIVLMDDGHTVTTAMNDASAPISVLLGDLTSYDLVVWSGTTGFRSAATFANLTSYVTAGGRVFYTGYDSTLGDTAVQTFLGGTGSYDFPSAPGAISLDDNALTTGVFDIRTVVPSGYYSDRDGLTGLLADTVSVSADTGGRGGHEWTLRTLGDGFIAWVSNGTFSGSHASWSTIAGPVSGRVYNLALRNFAYNAGGFSGSCMDEASACTSAGGRPGICHGSRCCIGCWDGTRCYSGTSGSECGIDGGACISCSDGMACTLEVCTAGVCSNPMAPTGFACQDGAFCTVGETCDAGGVCSGGRANLCDDMSPCTADVCDETAGVCTHAPGGSGCFIAGRCYGAFTVNSSNRCQACTPSVNATAWSPRTVGTPCGTASCTGAPGSAVLNDGGRCDATGTCAASVAMPCPQGTCASFDTCARTCSTGTCPEGRTCNATTMTCVPPAALGSVCTVGADCASGNCADRVCCSSRCDQLCDSCDLAESIGTCMATPVGGSCGVPICSADRLTLPGACDADGDCMRSAPERCPQGFCADAATCSPTCDPDSCAPGEICTEGQICVRPAANGASCGANDHCTSDFCVDGVCCNSACDDICEACTQTDRLGRCTPYTLGLDPELECPTGSVCSGGHACMPGPDAPVRLDGGPPDAGPPPLQLMPRDCSCVAAGVAAPTRGALGAFVSLLAGLLVSRRRRA